MTYAVLGIASSCASDPAKKPAKPARQKMMTTLDKVALVADVILVGAVVTLASLIIARTLGANLGSLNTALSAAKWYPAPLLFTTGLIIFTADIIRMLMRCRAPKVKAKDLPKPIKKETKAAEAQKTSDLEAKLQKQQQKLEAKLQKHRQTLEAYYSLFQNYGIDPKGKKPAEVMAEVMAQVEKRASDQLPIEGETENLAMRLTENLAMRLEILQLHEQVKGLITSPEADVSTLEKAITQLDKETKQLQSQVSYWKENDSKIYDIMQKKESKLYKLNQKYESQLYELRMLNSELMATQAKVSEVEKALGAYQQQDGKSLAETIAGLVTMAKTSKNESSTLSTKLETEKQELNDQVKSLESELKQLQSEVSLAQNELLKVDYKQVGASIQDLASHVASIHSDNSSKLQELERLKIKLQALTGLFSIQPAAGKELGTDEFIQAITAAEKNSTELTTVKREKKSLEDDIAKLKENQIKENKNISKIESEKKILEQSNSQLVASNKTLAGEKQNLQDENRRLQAAISSQQSDANTILQLKKDNKAQLDKNQELAKERDLHKSNVDQLNTELSTLKRENTELKSRQVNPPMDQSGELQKLREENVRLREEIRALKDKKAPTELEVQQIRTDANNQLAIKQGRIKQLEAELTTTRAQLHLNTRK